MNCYFTVSCIPWFCLQHYGLLVVILEIPLIKGTFKDKEGKRNLIYVKLKRIRTRSLLRKSSGSKRNVRASNKKLEARKDFTKKRLDALGGSKDKKQNREKLDQ